MVTPEIQESLLSTEHIGQAQVEVFVDNRLCEPPDSKQYLDLKSFRLRNLLLCKKSHNLLRASTNLSKWTGTFCKGQLRQEVNILQHEPIAVPLSLATASGSLHPTNKSVLANILTPNLCKCHTQLTLLSVHCWLSTWKAAWH